MPIDIRKPLKKLLPFLIKAQEDNLNEADTLQRIVKVFEEVLGYDLMTEITREKQVRDKYVDLAIKIDGVTKFLVEAKAAGVSLRDRHIEQAQHYAAEDNVRWVILTNGVTWYFYHLNFEDGIDYQRVFSVDLATDQVERAADLLSMLHRQSVRKGEHLKYWERRVALSPESIGKILFTEETLRLLRRQLKKSEGMPIDEEDLAQALHDMFSTEARERIGPLKIRRNRKVVSKILSDKEDSVSEPCSPIVAPVKNPSETVLEAKAVGDPQNKEDAAL